MAGIGYQEWQAAHGPVAGKTKIVRLAPAYTDPMKKQQMREHRRFARASDCRRIT